MILRLWQKLVGENRGQELRRNNKSNSISVYAILQCFVQVRRKGNGAGRVIRIRMTLDPNNDPWIPKRSKSGILDVINPGMVTEFMKLEASFETLGKTVSSSC